MFKSALSGLMLILLLVGGFTFMFNIQSAKSEPMNIIVPDDYPTIQEAINNASEGEIIHVKAGIYNESLTINKPIGLIGQYPDTIIHSYNSLVSVLIEADNVVVEGFSIYNVPYYPWVPETGRWCVMIRDCNNVTLCNNVMSAGSLPPPFTLGAGIGMSKCDYANIVYNVITDNHQGLGLAGSGNLLAFNTVEDSEIVGIYIVMSSDNKIYHNNFINNAEQVVWLGDENTWDDGYPSGGNYWDDYYGADSYSGPYQNETGGDYIWDTPYVIGGNATDRYPLVNPCPWRRYRWITIPGDLTHDGKIDILDIASMASMYGCREGEPSWNQGLPRCKEADLARPYGIIDILDLVTCASHYGETYP